MIELITKNGSINLTKPTGGGIAGEDGGYYIPFVDENGNLSWQASEPDMPPVEAVNIKGPQGNSGVYVGSGEMPEGYNVQIDIEGEATDFSGFVPTTRKIANIDLVDDITFEELKNALKIKPHTVEYLPPDKNTAGETGELYFSISTKQMYAMVDASATDEGMVYKWVQLSNPEVITAINENSTDEQIASAKAIKDYVSTAINEALGVIENGAY